jgi:hypothetical protein
VEPLAPQPERLIVHAVLDAGAQALVVRVGWTTNRTENAAVVTLTTPDLRALSVPRDQRENAGPGSYWLHLPSAGAAVSRNGRFGLRVAVGPVVVTGTTTVPNADPGSVTGPFPLRISRDTVDLAWAAVPGTRTYLTTVQSHFSSGTGSIYNGLDYSELQPATTLTLPANARTRTDSPVFRENETAVVIASAVDDNYNAYYRHVADPLAGALPSRLNGGYGVFGSIVPLQIRVYSVVP